MMRHAPNLVLSLLLLAVLGGCQTIQEKQSSLNLESTLNSYGKVARWGKITQLYDFLGPELSAEAVIPEGLDNIRVTGYEVMRSPVRIDETHATQSVSISYILRDRQVEHSIMDHQEWLLEPEKKLWHRNNPIPEFR